MNWSNSWSTEPNPWPNQQGLNEAAKVYGQTPKSFDEMSQDELLVRHLALKEALTKIKDEEMTLRKYIVNRAFPEKHEGTNTVELGNGYQLKAAVKFNYTLADNDTVEKTLDKIAKIGNQGNFIADRLVSWTPNFLITEYRNLVEAAPASAEAQEILSIVGEMLTINEAAPELNIKEPKGKKK